MKLENILSEFISILKHVSKQELRNNLFDRKNTPQLEAITFDELLQDINVSHRMNFFPSENKGACYEVAMFVSFHKPVFGLKFKKDQMVTLDEVLKKIVQQVLGTCYPTNQKIILITDKIDTEVFEPWLGNLKAMKRMGTEIEIVYLKSDGDYKMINSLLGV
jgi:hypothetical protein